MANGLPKILNDIPISPQHSRQLKGKKTRSFLLPWEIDFAEWLSRQTVRPGIQEQVEKAQELTQKVVGRQTLASLKRRPVFQDLITKLNTDAINRSRALLEHRYPRGVEAHFQALEMAMAQGDYKAVPSFTVPVLDRVSPKKQEGTTVTAIQITLQPGQQEMLEAEVIEVTGVKMPTEQP